MNRRIVVVQIGTGFFGVEICKTNAYLLGILRKSMI